VGTLVALVVLAGVTAVVSGVRAVTRLNHLEPGLERTATLNSLWSLGGSGGIILSIALGMPPLSVGLAPRMGVLGGAAVLIAVGSVRNRRLAAARDHALLQTGAPGTSLADQLEALESQRLRYRRVPLRFSVALTGGKVIAAATSISVLRYAHDTSFLLLFGAVAALSIGWLAWDVVSAVRRKAGRDRIDQEIAALLNSRPAGSPGAAGSADESSIPP